MHAEQGIPVDRAPSLIRMVLVGGSSRGRPTTRYWCVGTEGRSVSMAALDFFVSYAGADQTWAEWIAQTLEDAGYTTVLQAWDFRPGDNFIQRMDHALADADRVLAVLSPAYFVSEYTRDEWTAALVRARGERDRLLPVRIEAVELPRLLANRIFIDLVDLDERAAAARLLAGIQQGRASVLSR
jgi:TIR domain